MDKAQDKYRAILIEIKRRTAVIDAFHKGDAHALFVPTTVESTCLQIRKILELIAFSSLIANIETYSKQYEKFAENWNAKFMLKDMSRVNPDFYPKPIIQTPSKKPGITSEWSDRKDDFLSQEEFIKVYEKCGAILHADNPYGSKIDHDYYLASAREWRHKIVNLLNAHTIKLVGDKNLYLFQMGAADANPSYNVFAPVES